jgi:hypothetical protein
LLFAFAIVRNAQPGTPPIGTYSDFISFFWAEVIIALSGDQPRIASNG